MQRIFEKTECETQEKPCMLSIWPSLRAAPRTLQRVSTIFSALAGVTKELCHEFDEFSVLFSSYNINFLHTKAKIILKWKNRTFNLIYKNL